MEPGGESTQYESIRTVTTTPPKDKGQLGATQKNTISELRILSEDKTDNEQDENEGDVAKDPNLMSAQTAGEIGGISGEANKDLKKTRSGEH